MLERIGRRVAPEHAAFGVLTITVPERPVAQPGLPPFMTATDHDEPSVFQVENLLREARRQRGVIPPGRRHHVDIAGPVTFTLEFHRKHDRADIAPG